MDDKDKIDTDTSCEVCKKETGTKRVPHLNNREEVERMSYFSCDKCFEAVWAGAN